MYDLAISEYGDLIMGANHDLAGISGSDLIDQRIRMRLMIRRGSWVFDDDGTLGSNLFRVIGMSPADASSSVLPLVREALRGMEDEISITDIQIAYQNSDGVLSLSSEGARSIVIIVRYNIVVPPSELSGVSQGSEGREISITLPVIVAGGGT